MSQKSFEFGKRGEELVLEHYLNNGHDLIDKNFQYYRKGAQGRQAEIDLITTKNNRIYMIEVKSRSSEDFGAVQEQITISKLRHLYSGYLYFISKYPIFKNAFWQFDLACVLGANIEIIPNAYQFDRLLK